MTQDDIRLSESGTRKKNWERWGPYLSERAWVKSKPPRPTALAPGLTRVTNLLGMNRLWPLKQIQ